MAAIAEIAQGRSWLTDLAKPRRCHIDRGFICCPKIAQSICRKITCAMVTSNGAGLSLKRTRVYVAETILGWVRQWKITEPG
jgi:hypothetical protein